MPFGDESEDFSIHLSPEAIARFREVFASKDLRRIAGFGISMFSEEFTAWIRLNPIEHIFLVVASGCLVTIEKIITDLQRDFIDWVRLDPPKHVAAILRFPESRAINIICLPFWETIISCIADDDSREYITIKLAKKLTDIIADACTTRILPTSEALSRISTLEKVCKKVFEKPITPEFLPRTTLSAKSHESPLSPLLTVTRKRDRENEEESTEDSEKKRARQENRKSFIVKPLSHTTLSKECGDSSASSPRGSEKNNSSFFESVDPASLLRTQEEEPHHPIKRSYSCDDF